MEHWFVEEEKGKARYGFAYTEELFHQRSPFQDIKIIDTVAYGRMMILDDFVMLTERDEFIYHEMIAHIPVGFHHDPRRAIVIGGGDGGTVRELLKYPHIEEIVLCEIDAMVVDVSRKFFPQVASGLSDPRVHIKIGDGLAYVLGLEQSADIIIIDSTDPIGPGVGLFTAEFYQGVARALKPGGVMAAQSESPWHDASILQRIHSNIHSGFKTVKPYLAPIPTYPRGLWSWVLASQADLTESDFSSKRFLELADGLQYLTLKGVAAAFDIPPFYRQKLQPKHPG